jgi:hypothetical protein
MSYYIKLYFGAGGIECFGIGWMPACIKIEVSFSTIG